MALRNSYDFIVDQKMRSTVKKITGGNPNYLSYWKKVKLLDSSYNKYSAESLKAHWLLLMKKDKNNSNNQESLQIKSYDEEDSELCTTPHPYNYNMNSINQNEKFDYITKTERPELSDFGSERENRVKLEIPLSVEIVKQDSYMDCMSYEKIDEVFENLIYICRFISQNKKLSEKEIIRVLLNKRGKISDVIKYYLSIIS